MLATFMTKWAKDVDDAQFPDGSIPAVVPYAAEVPKDEEPLGQMLQSSVRGRFISPMGMCASLKIAIPP
jgi:hypothetical protein